MIRPKIVLDGDDVILKTGEKKVEWIKENYRNVGLYGGGMLFDIKPEQCSRTALTPLIGHEGYEEMVGFVYSREGTLTIEPVEGALEGVKELAASADLFLLSARKEHQTEATIEWSEKYDIAKHFLQINSTHNPIYANIESSEHPRKVDISIFHGAYMFVDDDLRHMPSSEVEGLTCVLFGERKGIPQHLVPARNWKENIRIARKYIPK